LSVTDPAAANKEWTVIDRMMADQSPVAVLFTPKYIDFLSKRVKNYVFNAQYYWGQTSAWIQ
jgi:peptide/nickel transport system substrate-binding protein